jgi:hypothetical protein
MELTMSELNLLNQELFGNPDSAISDIKFYPGEGSFKASIYDIAKHTRLALEAIRDGNCRDIDLTT